MSASASLWIKSGPAPHAPVASFNSDHGAGGLVGVSCPDRAHAYATAQHQGEIAHGGRCKDGEAYTSRTLVAVAGRRLPASARFELAIRLSPRSIVQLTGKRRRIGFRLRSGRSEAQHERRPGHDTPAGHRRPDHGARDIAKLLLERQISAVPVVDASGALLGIVSECDLVRRRDVDRDGRRSWWLQMLAEGEDLAGVWPISAPVPVGA